MDSKVLTMPIIEYKRPRVSADEEESENLVITRNIEANPVFDPEDVIKSLSSTSEPGKKSTERAPPDNYDFTNLSCIAVEDSKSSVKLFESAPKNEKTLENIKF
jgi:hypothetical protein